MATVDRAPRRRRPTAPRTTACFDTGARLLETVVLIFEDGTELVIHAMPCRKKYLDLLP
jgi:hypothetical protein